MKYFAPLKIKDILSMTGLIILGFGWILIDQYFLKQPAQRFVAFIVVLLLLFYLQFLINKPEIIWYYANSIALICLIFVIITSVVMHVIINHDFSGKSILIWIITGMVPYLAGYIYKNTKK